MSKREIVKEYSNGELTVIWKPQLCIHSAICVKTLPEVYDPNEKPWIKPENASTEALKSQIAKCPSGALTYRMDKEEVTLEDPDSTTTPKAEVVPNGPLLVYGDLEVQLADGSKTKKKRSTAFCRCGGSSNKPYCDGTHTKIEFKD